MSGLDAKKETTINTISSATAISIFLDNFWDKLAGREMMPADEGRQPVLTVWLNSRFRTTQTNHTAPRQPAVATHFRLGSGPYEGL
jgi:hypothetical protein